MGLRHWLLKDVYSTIHRLECKMASNQEELNARVAKLSNGLANVKEEVQNLKDQVDALPTEVPLDFTALDAALADLDDADGVPGAEGPGDATPPVANPVI